jgi:hypothetical protein
MNEKIKARSQLPRGIYTFEAKSIAMAKGIARSRASTLLERKELGESLIREAKKEMTYVRRKA